MGSIYDFEKGPDRPVAKEPRKRSRHREKLTPTELAEGKRKLSEMVDGAFQALEEAMTNADHPTAIKAAQIILDRAGFGPKSTVDVNSTHIDLSELSREELASRALKVAERLRNKGTEEPEPAAPQPSIH